MLCCNSTRALPCQNVAFFSVVCTPPFHLSYTLFFFRLSLGHTPWAVIS